jgi:hypothetical protein
LRKRKSIRAFRSVRAGIMGGRDVFDDISRPRLLAAGLTTTTAMLWRVPVPEFLIKQIDGDDDAKVLGSPAR